MSSVLDQVQSASVYLSTKERRVAEWVVANPEKILNLRITDLALASKSSTATVTRFCKSLGFSGYREFCIACAKELQNEAKEKSKFSKDNSSSRWQTQLDELIKREVAAIEDTLSIITEDHVNSVVSALLSARSINIIGIGGSGVAAMDLYHKLTRSGLMSSYHADIHWALPAVSLLNKNDVLILISYSGETVEILEAATMAVNQQVSTVSITGAVNSKLARMSNHVLVTRAAEGEYRAAAMASRIAQLAIIDALFVRLRIALGDVSSERLYLTHKSVKHHKLKAKKSY